jgi:hypothetical protein
MSAPTPDDELGVDRSDPGDLERPVSDEAGWSEIITPSLASIEKTLAMYRAVTARLCELKARMQAEECTDSKGGIQTDE